MFIFTCVFELLPFSCLFSFLCLSASFSMWVRHSSQQEAHCSTTSLGCEVCSGFWWRLIAWKNCLDLHVLQALFLHTAVFNQRQSAYETHGAGCDANMQYLFKRSSHTLPESRRNLRWPEITCCMFSSCTVQCSSSTLEMRRVYQNCAKGSHLPYTMERSK